MYKCVINNCDPLDAGAFAIKAKNPIGEVSSNLQLVVLSPPKFTKRLSGAQANGITIVADENEYRINANEKVQIKLECQVTGNPKPQIRWFKDGQEITSSDKLKLESKQDNHVLLIKDATLKDQGLYEVKAESACGSVTSLVYIEVNQFPKFVTDLVNSELTLGTQQKGEFFCSFVGKPKPESTWFIGDEAIKDDGENYLIANEETTVETDSTVFNTKLTIQNIDNLKSGVVKCVAKNTIGEATSKATIGLLKAPKFAKQLNDVLDVVESKEIKLECVINGDATPKPTVAWFKDANTLNASKRIVIGKPVADSNANTVSYSLSILDAIAGDAGVYSLKVDNKVETIESKCIVNILSAPKIVKDLKPNVEFTEDDKAAIEVQFTGRPIPECKWYQIDQQNEKEIVSEPDLVTIAVSDSNVFRIEFNSIKKSYEGQHVLKLTNAAGSAQTKCNIVVNCKSSISNNNQIQMVLLSTIFYSFSALPTITKPLENVSVTEGSECSLLLEATGSPTPTIEWYRANTKLKPDKRYTQKFEESEKKYILTIVDAKSVDQGQYKAVLKNKVGQLETNEVQLSVTGEQTNENGF